MKVLTASITAGIILASLFSLPVMGAEDATITITMTGLNEISVTLDKTQWPLGNVASNTVYETSPQIEWCTLTIQGTCNVNTFIVGEDAKWVNNPGAYSWTLSNDGSNGEHIYGLWFRISHDTERGYVAITKTQTEFWPYSGKSSLTPGSSKQFGLRLVTPTYFYSGRPMQTQVTISAVAA